MAADDRAPGVEWTDAEREAVMRVVDAHRIGSTSGGTATGAWCDCSCGERSKALTRDMAGRAAQRHLASQLLAALAPFVAEREAQAAAKALREAAETAPEIAKHWPEDIFEPVSKDEPDPVARDRVAAHMARHSARVIFPQWLRERADEIEQASRDPR